MQQALQFGGGGIAVPALATGQIGQVVHGIAGAHIQRLDVLRSVVTMPCQQTQGLGGGMDAGGQAGHGRQVFQRRAGVRIAPQARTADQRG